MRYAALSNGESKLMELLWEHALRTLGKFAEKLHDEAGWMKGTIYTMLNKKIIRADGSGRCQEYTGLFRQKKQEQTMRNLKLAEAQMFFQ